MRYPPERRAETRHKIVETASRRFRAEGIAAVGVASLMQSAGLTHGGFYSHFESKDELVALALVAALGDTLAMLRGAAMAQPEGQRLQGLVQAYASTDHQRNPGYGCVLSALAGELKHQNEPVRLALEGRLQQFLALISDMADADHLQVDARAVLALMTGAVALSRLPGDAASAQGFLQAAVASLGTLATPRTSPP